MTVSEKIGGTQAATIGTEHVLATVTDAGTYQLLVDTDNMVNGDELELRVKTKVRSTSSSKEMFGPSYAHNQGNKVIKISAPIPAPFEFVATLKQTAGTSRDFIWSIYEY